MSIVFGFVLKDLIDAGRVNESDIAILREWNLTEKLPKFTDELLAIFFMACKNHIENTKMCARAYYFARRDTPEIFDNRDLLRADIQHQLKMLEFVVMPQRTDEGHVILLHRLLNFTPSEYHMDVAMKLLFMTVDICLYDNPPTGLIVLFDMKGVSFMHLTRIKLWAMKKFFYYVQEGLPLQLVKIHVLNVVWFFDKILKLSKPFYKPYLLELLFLHQTDMDMNKFHETCIPKKCLPSDYGGDLPSIQELHLKTQEKMEEMQQFFVQEQAMRS